MKLYQLTRQQRLAYLRDKGILSLRDYDNFKTNQPIPAAVADSMIENQLTQYSLPEGIVLDVLIDSQIYQIPMVTEEPSVIAAANNACKIIAQAGGFHTTVNRKGVIGQIVFEKMTDPQAQATVLKAKQTEIKTIADKAYPSIVARGGGLITQTVAVVGQDFVKLELLIDTKAAMGANMVNTICEAVAKQAAKWINAEVLMAILSNAAPQDVTRANVKIPVELLAKPGQDGYKIAEKIVSASEFAQLDVHRAVTHNKGIMNGITAVALAYGNDTRALNACIHSFTAQSGQYLPLSSWKLENQTLIGQLSVPLPIGSVGGSIGIVPIVKSNQNLGHAQDPLVMQSQLASIGLASNLAALKALVTEGIQKGHMHLQYKSLAIQAGARSEEINWLQQALSRLPHANLEVAQKLLKTKRQTN